MRERRCGTCFYGQDILNYGMVECHLHAPVWRDAAPQHPYGDMPQNAFPRVRKEDWCGEWALACEHSRTKDFDYDSDGKIATEHSCLDCDKRWTTFAVPPSTVSE
jgi:hypothetical protein